MADGWGRGLFSAAWRSRSWRWGSAMVRRRHKQQTRLPEIVVTRAEPDRTGAAAPRRPPGPATAPAPATPEPRRPPPAELPPGWLPIVADQFATVTVVTPRGDCSAAPAARSATSCSPSPASPARASRPAPRAARSCAVSTPIACASRRTASARAACRSSARITPCRSIRWRPSGSRWCAARRPCAGARRRSAAWSTRPTTGSPMRCPARRRRSRAAWHSR